MFSILGQTLRIAAARWPLILAFYLAGWLLRYGLIEVAAFAGAQSALIGFLIMPTAILARLGSYIAIFLVLRGSMPAFSSMRERGADSLELAPGEIAPRKRVTDIFLASIVPFFVFYAAWQFLQEDTIYYAQVALSKINVFDDDRGSNSVFALVLDPVTASIIVGAFIGRLLLKRFAARLPQWTSLVAVYLEAVWVYLVLFLISDFIDDAKTWVETRVIVHDLIDLKNSAVALVSWIVDAAVWLINEAGGLILLPIAWLALAGVVYGRALAAPTLAFPTSGRVYERMSERVSALPKGVVRRARELGADLGERVVPVTNALLLIWRAGVVPMGVYILAYTVLDAASEWLWRAAVLVIGPHELGAFWMNIDSILSFGIDSLIEPLQLCLIAAAYDFCLRKLEERRTALEVQPQIVG